MRSHSHHSLAVSRCLSLSFARISPTSLLLITLSFGVPYSSPVWTSRTTPARWRLSRALLRAARASACRTPAAGATPSRRDAHPYYLFFTHHRTHHRIIASHGVRTIQLVLLNLFTHSPSITPSIAIPVRVPPPQILTPELEETGALIRNIFPGCNGRGCCNALRQADNMQARVGDQVI